MTGKKTNILIVGAGKGGSLLIDMFHKSGLVKILGVVDRNPDAPGIKLAKKLRIPTSGDFKKFINKKDLEEIINVTGREKVQKELLRLKPPCVEVIGGYSAKFMWGLVEERKKIEVDIKKSEEKLRNIIEHSNELFYVHDTRHKLTYASPQSKEILGYSPDEMLTEWTNLITENPINKIAIRKTEQALKTGKRLKPYFLELYRKDRSKVLLEIDESPLKDSVGNIVGIVGAARDITEHKQAEEALRESEEKFRAISSTAVDAILVMDNEGRISYWNPSAERIFGYTSDEALGRELHAFLAPSRYYEAYKNGMECFKKTGKGPAIGKTSEFFAIRKDGSEFPIEVSTSAIRIKGEWHSVGIVRDITDRKLAEVAIRESEIKYRALFEESKDVVYISTPGGRFLDINAAGVELFGYPSKKNLLMIDIARDLYVHPSDREEFKEILAKKGYVKDYEVMFKRKNGQHLIVLVTATAVRDDKGNITAYRGIIKDISDRKRLEHQLTQAQKMEAVGQLAGGIAHDFNNILTAIIGFATLLKMETDKDDPRQSYVKHILSSSERAANLTQALLAFSRKQIISPKPVDLNEIIKGVKDLLSRIIGEDIELSTFLTDNDLTIMADSGQIEQILMNLATNARDAMPDGGSLSITTDLLYLDQDFTKAHGFKRPGFYAAISFGDTGVGIDDTIKAKIFEPFFTTKEVGKGTGLGLSMAYGIIQQHDGYIEVYSEVGRGTVFNIYLPLIKSAHEEKHEAVISGIKKGTETVLVAEDDARVRTLIKDVLTGFGYTVLEAEDGSDALRVFSEHKDNIRLVILDVIMPKFNGKEIFDKIKKIRPDIRVIFTSGYDANIIHKKGILEEHLHFISKPILPEDLLKKVREILDGK